MRYHALVGAPLTATVVLAAGSAACTLPFDPSLLVDGSTSDGLPNVCPELGSGLVPQFSQVRNRFIPENLYLYNLDEGGSRAVAWRVNTQEIVEGPADKTGVMIPSGLGQANNPHLSPEGDQLFAVNDTTIVIHDRVGEAWAPVVTIPANLEVFGTISAPTRAGTSRRMLRSQRAVGLEELDESSTPPWSLVRAHALADLGVTSADHPALSPDGLRLVFRGATAPETRGAYYADRTSIDQPFGRATMIPLPSTGSVPDATLSPYMTSDCRKLYLYMLSEVYLFEW